jgi:hypothetical protein
MQAETLIAWLALLAAAIVAGCAYLVGRRDLALGVLVMTATFSWITAPIGDLDVRFEQPTILVLGVLVLSRDRRALRELVARSGLSLLGFGVYLAAGVSSSLLVSPDPMQSLKISAWLAYSMIAGAIVGAIILRGRGSDLGVSKWIIASAAIQSVVACIQVIAEIALLSDWGVARLGGPIGKAYGLSWEPNLLAISLSVALVLLVVPAAPRAAGGSGWPRRGRVPALILIAIGIALALSRGGMVGLAAGLVVLAPAVIRSYRAAGNSMAMRAFLAQGSLAIGIAVAGYLTLTVLGAAGVGVRPGDIINVDSGPPSPLIAVGQSPDPSRATQPPGTSPPGSATGPSASSLRPSPDPSASPLPSTPVPSNTRSEPPRYVGAGDTVGFRLRNMQRALEDGLRRGPIIGLGPDSFGMRYMEPSCACPAHIPDLLSATVYESGIIGLIGLGVGVISVLVGVWRTGRYDYAAAIVALFAGYEFTDALRLASNWIILGTAVGLMLAINAAQRSSVQADSDTG